MCTGMYILGITEKGHDSAACLMKDGKLICMVEEERLSREKNAKGKYPIRAIKYCLESNGISLSDITYIAVGWNVKKYENVMIDLYAKLDRQYEKDALTRSNEEDIFFRFRNGKLEKNLKSSFLSQGIKDPLPPIIYVDHHVAHALSTYHCSGFNEALIFCIDGSGENYTTTVWLGNDKDINLVTEYELPHSLGWFYSCITEFLGFSPNQQEGTVMGLAPYGKRNSYVRSVLERILHISDDRYVVNPEYIFYGNHSYGNKFTDRLVDELGIPRQRNEEIGEIHKDIACEAQDLLETVVRHLVETHVNKTGVRNVCFSGGVAMNCKLNGYIAQLSCVDRFFVQPASYDAGTSLGAAISVFHELGVDTRYKMEHPYWGCCYSNEQIEQILKFAKIKYRKLDDVSFVAATYLNNNKIIAWFQGAMEIGARALGARSILANPLRKDMKDVLNNQVKFREWWRPFAPSMTIENYKAIFGAKHIEPFMLTAMQVPTVDASRIPSVVHVDMSARPQCVDPKTNFRYWKLLDDFYSISGVPAVLNTSFNVKGEPIVCSPNDALRCFFSTGIDALFIGDFLVEK